MATDLRHQLLDEIALEGLDGITINTLWVRLTERLDFKLSLDDASKSYLWNCVLCQSEVEFYKLPEERPDLVPYNRFHYVDPETHHFLETVHTPDDIYPVSVVNDDGIRGSCPTYETRTNVTEDIRNSENRLSLQEVVERYGNCLVLVASQTLRWRTLVGEMSDPNYPLTDLQYCVTERIGRARYQGELSVGKQSLQAFKESSKTIFYLIKKILGLGVVTKQTVTVVRKPSNAKITCMLYHLKRFHVGLKQRWLYEIQQVAEFISSFPDQMVKVSVLRANFNFKDTNFKRIIRRTDVAGERFFEFKEVPYRLVYPDAPTKEYIAKNLKGERVIRHVKLVKDPKDAVMTDVSEPVDSDDDEPEEGTAGEGQYEQVYDKPALAQMYTYIKNHGSKGVSQKRIEQAMTLDRLAVRRRLKMLILQGSITTVLHDFGKTKRGMYVSNDALEENPIHQNVTAEMKKFDKMTMEKETKVKPKPGKHQYKKSSDIEIKLITAPPSDERTMEIKAELERVEEGNTHHFKKPLNPEQEKTIAERLVAPSSSTFQNVTIEEMPLDEKLEKKRPNEKVGMERFGTLLTETHIRRANWIIEIVQAIKLLEEYQLIKILRHREEQMKFQFHMDRKSLKRLVNALVEERKIRAMKVTIKVDTKEKTLSFVTDMDVTPTSEVVRKVVEEAKLKHFSVSKEELRGACKIKRVEGPPTATEASPPKKKKFSAEVPESALESILKHQDFKKKISNKPPPMKYNNKAGPIYGLLPKFVRAQKVHQILWYLCYETYGKDMKPITKIEMEYGQSGETRDSLMTASEKIDIIDGQPGQDTMKEPPMYVDELSWKRYLAPVRLHEGYPRGWCFISDVLLQLPVVTFCQIVNVCYDIPGLLEILSHPIQKFYPVKSLPFHISQQLLFARRYVHSFHENCLVLCEMGLLSFGPDSMKQKELTFIYIHNKASLLDTRESLLGYQKTRPPPGTTFPRKTYELTSEENLNNYWEDLQIVGLGSNMGFKSAIDTTDEETNEEYSFKEALMRKTPSTVEDVGKIPGDMRGAAGLDSSIYSHTVRSWTADRNKWKSEKIEKYKERKPLKKNIPKPEPEKDGTTSTEKGKKPKLGGGVGKKWKVKLTKNVKGNKGGKGVKRNREPYFQGQGITACTGSYSRRRNFAVIRKPKVYYKKPVAERGDVIDQSIFSEKKKQRCTWSPPEDSLLLICNVASLLMEQNRKTLIVTYSVVRDILREKCFELSYDKTSMACARRLKFAMKNPITVQNMSLFFQEASLDQYVIKEYSSKQWVSTDEHSVIPKFKTLVTYLMKKFHTLSVGRCELPETLSELEDCSIKKIGSTLKTKRVFSDVASKTDICHDVLRNILHGSVLLQDKQGRAHEMFKLLTQYPETLLNAVISEMRNDGLLVINKAFKDRLRRITPGIGLRNFKASQKYMYNYKQRYLSALFEDSGNLLNSLIAAHRDKGEGLELEFNPKSCQAVILMPLMLTRKIDMKVTLPEELVIVDLEGFYQFPWGRGKLASKSEKFKQSTEELQELFPGTDLKQLKLPQESTPVVPANLTAPVVESSPHVDGNESSPVVDSSPDVGGKVSSSVVESSPHVNGKELAAAGDIEVSESLTKAVGSKESGSVAENVGSALTSDDKDNTDVRECDINTRQVIASNGNQNDDGTKSVTDNEKSANDSVLEQIEEPESDDMGVEEAKKTVDSSENFGVKYDVLKHGSSELLLPQYEVVFKKELTQQQTTIASRTLLNLRRSDEEALEEIRIFNAQDNFVVNSCVICVKLREKEKSASNAKGSVCSEATQDFDSGRGLESVSARTGLDIANGSSETIDKVASGNTDHDSFTDPEIASVSTETLDKVADVRTETEDSEATDLASESVCTTMDEQETETKRKEYMNKKDVYSRLQNEARKKEDDEKEKILDRLLLRREKITKVWSNLQLILPFQLDIGTVWKHLQARGLSSSEIIKCQDVYDIIETSGELGIKQYDLQFKVTFEPPHDKTNKVACVPCEDSDQPGHPPSLIRVFAVRMKKHWALYYLLSVQ